MYTITIIRKSNYSANEVSQHICLTNFYKDSHNPHQFFLTEDLYMQCIDTAMHLKEKYHPSIKVKHLIKQIALFACLKVSKTSSLYKKIEKNIQEAKSQLEFTPHQNKTCPILDIASQEIKIVLLQEFVHHMQIDIKQQNWVIAILYKIKNIFKRKHFTERIAQDFDLCDRQHISSDELKRRKKVLDEIDNE